jgi:lambda family phage tail tape measure protein
MSDSLANFATTGKFNFKSLTLSILSDLAKMEVRIAASKILTSIISAWGSSYGTGSGNVASVGVSNG